MKRGDSVKLGTVRKTLTDAPDLPRGPVATPPGVTLAGLPPFESYFAGADTEATPAAPTASALSAAAINSITLGWEVSSYALWRHYEVHEGTTAGFTPGAGNLKLTTKSNVVTITNAPGSGPWYYKVCALNDDGTRSEYTPFGPYTLGKVDQAALGNIAITNAQIASCATDKLTAGSVLIGTALIGDAAITNAKIVTLDVAKLTTGTLAVGTTITVGSGASRVLIGQLGDTSVGAVSATRVGTWADTASAAYYGGTAYYSATTSSTIQWSFTGTYVRVISGLTTNAGKVNVFIDGTFVETVDAYRATDSVGMLWQTTGLASGSHTVKLEISGTKHASSSNYYLYASHIEHDSGTASFGIRVIGPDNLIEGAILQTGSSGVRAVLSSETYGDHLRFYGATGGVAASLGYLADRESVPGLYLWSASVGIGPQVGSQNGDPPVMRVSSAGVTLNSPNGTPLIIRVSNTGLFEGSWNGGSYATIKQF